MHERMFAAFERICRGRLAAGARVLEIGAMPAADTLLALPALGEAGLRVGSNREASGGGASGHARGFSLVQVGADSLGCFADACFDAVLCNSTLEHDPAFWRTLAGIRRVARPGALIVLGVPGYAERPPARLGWTRWRWLTRLANRLNPAWLASTPTLLVHNFPGDYYRFSPQAMREVLMAGYTEVAVEVVMQPPRIIGYGRRAND